MVSLEIWKADWEPIVEMRSNMNEDYQFPQVSESYNVFGTIEMEI